MKGALILLPFIIMLAFILRKEENLVIEPRVNLLKQTERLLLDSSFNLSDYKAKFKGVNEHAFKKTISTSNNAALRIESKTLIKNADNSVVKQVKVFLTKPVNGHTFHAAINESGQFNQGTGDNDKTYVILEIWSNTKTVERAFSKLYTIDSDGTIEVVNDQKANK